MPQCNAPMQLTSKDSAMRTPQFAIHNRISLHKWKITYKTLTFALFKSLKKLKFGLLEILIFFKPKICFKTRLDSPALGAASAIHGKLQLYCKLKYVDLFNFFNYLVLHVCVCVLTLFNYFLFFWLCVYVATIWWWIKMYIFLNSASW